MVSATPFDYDILMKTVVVGDSGVGKSSLLYRYIDDEWCPTYVATIGVDFKVDTFECMGRVVKLQLWDTAGHERFKAMSACFYRGAHCIVLCYDVTDRESFEHVAAWIREVHTRLDEGVPKVLVGTKSDLMHSRVVSKAEADEFAASLGMKHYETSAKSGRSVHEALQGAVRDALAHRLESLTLETEVRKSRAIVLTQELEDNHARPRSCLQRFKKLLRL